MKTLAMLIGVGVLSFAIFTTLTDSTSLPALSIFSLQSADECTVKIKESYNGVPDESFEVTREDLNGDSTDDYIVRINDEESCGSAGCIYELCIFDAVGELTHIPFGFAAETVKPLDTLTNDMRDLEVNGDKSLRLQWNTRQYELIQ